jgi:hypothetical protein
MKITGAGIITTRGQNVENTGNEGVISTRSRSAWSVGKLDITIMHPGVLPMRMDIDVEDIGNASSEACCAISCSTH